MAIYVLATPEAGKFRALEDQLADDVGQIGCVRLETWEGSDVGDADPELAFPVIEKGSSCGMEEGITPDVTQRKRASHRGRRAAASRRDSGPAGSPLRATTCAGLGRRLSSRIRTPQETARLGVGGGSGGRRAAGDE
jgi:hypothetical protein